MGCVGDVYVRGLVLKRDWCVGLFCDIIMLSFLYLLCVCCREDGERFVEMWVWKWVVRLEKSVSGVEEVVKYIVDLDGMRGIKILGKVC